MKSIATTFAVLMTLAAAPMASADNAQFDRSIAWTLKSYGFDVDVSTLTTHQKAQIHLMAHSEPDRDDTRLRIQTVLEGSIINRLFN